MPVCPLHQTEMAPSKYGGFYCRGQMEDGTYCKQKVRPVPVAVPAPGVSVAPVLATAPRRPVADAAGFAQRDRLSAAQTAIKFAGDMYQGQPDKIGSAMALAHRIYKEFLMPCRLGAEFPDNVYDPDDWFERGRQ